MNADGLTLNYFLGVDLLLPLSLFLAAVESLLFDFPAESLLPESDLGLVSDLVLSSLAAFL